MARKKTLYRIADWMEDYGWQTLMAIIVIILGGLKLFFNSLVNCWSIFLVLALVCLYALAFYQNLKREQRISKVSNLLILEQNKSNLLRKSVAKWREGFDDFFRHSLIFLYNSLEYGVSERISVYQHNSEKNNFEMIGRYSENISFNQIGRGTYPDSQGFISKGWNGDAFCLGTLPDSNDDIDKYVTAVQKECNITKIIINNLNMKSRSYCIHNVVKPVTQERLGVIVLESLEYDKFNGEEAGKVADRINELFYAYINCKENC